MQLVVTVSITVAGLLLLLPACAAQDFCHVAANSSFPLRTVHLNSSMDINIPGITSLNRTIAPPFVFDQERHILHASADSIRSYNVLQGVMLPQLNLPRDSSSPVAGIGSISCNRYSDEPSWFSDVRPSPDFVALHPDGKWLAVSQLCIHIKSINVQALRFSLLHLIDLSTRTVQWTRRLMTMEWSNKAKQDWPEIAAAESLPDNYPGQPIGVRWNAAGGEMSVDLARLGSNLVVTLLTSDGAIIGNTTTAPLPGCAGVFPMPPSFSISCPRVGGNVDMTLLTSAADSFGAGVGYYTFPCVNSPQADPFVIFSSGSVQSAPFALDFRPSGSKPFISALSGMSFVIIDPGAKLSLYTACPAGFWCEYGGQFRGA